MIVAVLAFFQAVLQQLSQGRQTCPFAWPVSFANGIKTFIIDY